MAMLLKYVVTRIPLFFITTYGALLILFGCGDLLARLSTLPSASFIPLILLLLVPLMSLMVMPIALAWASCMLIARLLATYEMVFLVYLAHARRMIVYGTVVITILCSSLYIPLVSEWAPRKYWEAKQIIVCFAREKLLQLAAGQLHYPTDSTMMFFESKHYEPSASAEQSTVFDGMLFSYYNQEGSSCLVNARSGILQGDELVLIDGELLAMRNDAQYRMGFKRFALNLDQLFAHKPGADVGDSLRGKQGQMKYLTLHELHQASATSNKAYVAFHERIARIIWFFIVPLLAMAAMFGWGTIGSSNGILAMLISGGIFLFSYINGSIANALWKHPALAIALLYGSIILSVLFIFVRYRSHALR